MYFTLSPIVVVNTLNMPAKVFVSCQSGNSTPKSISLKNTSQVPLSSTFLTDAKIGLVSQPPELCEEGTGGTYFLKSKSKSPVAVFKPSDEGPLCDRNPKRTEGNNNFHFKGFQPGEETQREILAYQLDNNFAGVPTTIPAEVSHWIFTDKDGLPGSSSSEIKTKKGSLQAFVPDVQCSVDDMGYSNFSLSDVQRIAILDLLLVNCDRNGGNILVQKKSHKLVPIDHGFSLPDYRHVTDLQWFEWLTWKQAKSPVLPEIISFIEKFDLPGAIAKASALGIRNECLVTLMLSYFFLKAALANNLTLCEIGKLMCSRDDSPSVFATLISKASDRRAHSQDSLLSLFRSEVTKYFGS